MHRRFCNLHVNGALMRCEWEEFGLPDERGWRTVRCKQCGFVTAPTPHEKASVHRMCDRPGMGDYLSWGLSMIGITKARIAWITGKKCDCDKRQDELNELGKKLGL